MQELIFHMLVSIVVPAALFLGALYFVIRKAVQDALNDHENSRR